MLFYICISILTSHRFSFALCCYFSMKVNISQDQESSQSAAWLSNAALMWPLPDPHLSFCLSSSLSFTVQCHTYVSCVPVSVKEGREVLAPMEEKNLWFCFERVHLCCFVLVMWKRWINMHSQRDVCTVCTRVRLCVFLAGTLLWHRDSLCPLRLLRHQLVQRSSHQHDTIQIKHVPIYWATAKIVEQNNRRNEFTRCALAGKGFGGAVLQHRRKTERERHPPSSTPRIMLSS